MNPPSPIAARLNLAVIDMAGTTVDVADEIPEALRRAFASSHLDLPDDAIQAMRGRSKREAIHSLVLALSSGDEADTLSRRIYASFQQSLRNQYSRSVSPVPGAARAMRWLRSRGIGVVLTTGFDRSVASLLLERVGWTGDLVSGVVTSDDVQRGRPEPDMIHRAMDLVSVGSASEVAVVGDTTADLESGRRAGAGLIIGVLTGAHSRSELESHEHTAILNSIADLPEWLESH